MGKGCEGLTMGPDRYVGLAAIIVLAPFRSTSQPSSQIPANQNLQFLLAGGPEIVLNRKLASCMTSQAGGGV